MKPQDLIVLIPFFTLLALAVNYIRLNGTCFDCPEGCHCSNGEERGELTTSCGHCNGGCKGCHGQAWRSK